MNNKNNIMKKISKLLSLVLRHKPHILNLKMDDKGWVNVDELLINIYEIKGITLLYDELIEIVESNDKKRFTFNNNKSAIRANQGHSINVDLDMEELVPPSILYHGTVEKYLKDIKSMGLKKMNRQHVHLSSDIGTAKNVGSRRGKPIILEVNTTKMIEDGCKFYKSKNGVWLTDYVDSKYIEVLDYEKKYHQLYEKVAKLLVENLNSEEAFSPSVLLRKWDNIRD
tara:strand:+ start:31259 stop:31936 length:678 start_codon:yes stop_codon:yes gene_type:complete